VEFPEAIYHAMGRAMGGVKAFAKDEHRERLDETVRSDPVVARKVRAITASLLKGRRGQI
jgi:hypothetical protein